MCLFIKQYLLGFAALFYMSCNHTGNKTKKATKPVTVIVQPFNDIDKSLAESVFKMIQQVYPGAVLNNKIELPHLAYYEPRNRYKADSILKFFNSIAGDNQVFVGLTSKDISTRKDAIEDFGVMGLGFCPGKACVASSFRLDKKNIKEQLFKVAIHELGHTQGLPHCKIKFCLMRDAEGKNPTNEEKEFCNSCKQHLRNKGFQI